MENPFGVQRPGNVGTQCTASFAVIGHVIHLGKGSGDHMFLRHREHIAAIRYLHAIHQIGCHGVARRRNGGDGDRVACFYQCVVHGYRAMFRFRSCDAAAFLGGLVIIDGC